MSFILLSFIFFRIGEKYLKSLLEIVVKVFEKKENCGYREQKETVVERLKHLTCFAIRAKIYKTKRWVKSFIFFENIWKMIDGWNEGCNMMLMINKISQFVEGRDD